jgi:hypothetical protein
MADLHYQDTFSGTATQTTTITLAGQTNAGPLVPDHVIEVRGDLTDLVTYSGAYGSTAISGVLTTTYPMVAIDRQKLVDVAASCDAEWRGEEDALDSTGNSAVPTLRGLFKTLDWVYNSPTFTGDQPVEAVIGVTFGALSATTLSEALSAGNPFTNDVQGSAPVNLFEQCLAAGKFSESTLGDGSEGLTGGTGSAEFVEGDSVSIYVSYGLTKTRVYTPDLDNSGVSGGYSLSVGGVVFSGELSDESNEIPQIVRWKFIHTPLSPP